MIDKMEGSGEVHEEKDGLKGLAGDDMPECKDEDSVNDVKRFARERNLVLLSTLFKLYGEEWKQLPDWAKVAEEIANAKIPVFGENFTAESCQTQYKAIIDDGFQLGIYNTSTMFTLSAPSYLSEAKRRMYIIAATSDDLVESSKELDRKMLGIYGDELPETDTMTGIIDLMKITQELPHIEDTEEYDIDQYENLETQEVAAEIYQWELNKSISGMHDVLLFVKYCEEAVDHAVKQYKPSSGLYKSVNQWPAIKPEKAVEQLLTKTSTNKVSQEPTNVEQSLKAGTCNNDSPTITSPKLLESPKPPSGVTWSEISTVKPPEASPTSSKGKIKEEEEKICKIEEKEAESVLSLEDDQDPHDTTSLSTTPVKSADHRDINGEDSVNHNVRTEESTGLSLTSPTKEKVLVENSTPEKVGEPTKESKASVSQTVGNTEVAITEDSEATNASESSDVPETPDLTRQESPTKGKQAGRKSASAARPVLTRTSNRLVSPEPTQPPANEEEKSPKKTPGRQASTSESNTPLLRSRRGATPTKAMTIESEPVKNTGEISSKLDFDDDEFNTPQSTPESPEIKLDADSRDTKPPKQLKVYSAKPPSPLSHVDPTIFDEFVDDEDDAELAMIDNNVHKSKGDKTSKTYVRRGRAASSENTSEVGNNEESSSPSKKVTKKVASNDEADEGDGQGVTDDSASKRLTRSSLKLHDAANEEGPEAPQTESEKAVSESSFSGKEKKIRTSKSMLRLKNLQEEMSRVYGDGEELPEGKRVTRARVKTGITVPEKRNNPPSVGDSEGLSESEPVPTRATRSRSSTASSMPVLEPTVAQQPSAIVYDDEELKAFRKSAISFLEKIMSSELAVNVQKNLQDQNNILKCPVDFSLIRNKIENGKVKTISTVYSDLFQMGMNAVMANPGEPQLQETVHMYFKLLKTTWDDYNKNQGSAPSQKTENKDSDAESLESHDEQRVDPSKQTGGGGRRKRKRSTSETSEEIPLQENKRRVTRTSTSHAYHLSPKPKAKTKHPISPDIVSANRNRH